MENNEAIKQRMIKEGFSIINVYDDVANEVFPDHQHPGDQLLVVIRGSISIEMDGKISVLKAGDEMFFPANIIHSAKIDPEGCLYIDGEKPI